MSVAKNNKECLLRTLFIIFITAKTNCFLFFANFEISPLFDSHISPF